MIRTLRVYIDLYRKGLSMNVTMKERVTNYDNKRFRPPVCQKHSKHGDGC